MKIATYIGLGGLILGGIGTPAAGRALEATILADGAAALANVEAALGQEREQESPGGETYREAREALSRADYRRAYELFGRIVEREYADHVADALYWQAFAAYRLGGGRHLETALRALELQEAMYPGASTRADARELAVRVRGALARLGDAEAAERIAEQASRAAEAAARAAERSAGRAGAAGQEVECEGEEDEVRTAALNALLQMDSDRALPILEKVLARRDECSAPLRRRALFLVAQSEAPNAEEILLDVARSDPDPEVREQAVFWLSQVEGERALEILEEILSSADDPGLQEKAVFAISQHESPRAGEILRAYATDASRPEAIREKAIFWLGQHEGERNPAFLRELYGGLESTALKERVLFALSQTDDPASVDWLVERALDGTEPTDLRKKALFWANEAEVDLARLEGLYGRLTDPEMKEQLIFLYSQRDEPQAVDRLMEIARTEEDPELRKKAVFWLGQSDDPRAAGFLLELIER